MLQNPLKPYFSALSKHSHVTIGRQSPDKYGNVRLSDGIKGCGKRAVHADFRPASQFPITMSETPIIAAREPARVELTEGETYFWCRCGRSQSQPFCDGSHKGTEFTPLRFTAEKTGLAFLCQCKASGKTPHCDGTHKTL